MQSFQGKRVTVAGLGRFGGSIAVARWLVSQNARVLVTDRDPAEKLADSIRQLDGLPIEFQMGGHRVEDFTDVDLVVASPAMPPTNRFLLAAKNAGVPVTTEIRLFIERCPATILGVTGTKGKSTTTEMLGRMLKTEFKTWVGGNIGKSLLAELPQISKSDLVVLELSSFMLETLREIEWSPHVGLITMISSDHLDWHGSVEAYVEAKKNILRFQRADDYAVLNEEDPLSASLAGNARGKVLLYGLNNRKPFELLLPGRHNQLNAQGAFAAASIMGIDWGKAQKAIADFKGLPHRLEMVFHRDGIWFYNDSIATNPDAAIAALESFPSKKVIQIVGGKDKNLPTTVMCAALIERAKAVLCIGATGPEIARVLELSQSQRGAGVYLCGDLPTAVTEARRIAVSGDVVLLSPGFASQDQFDNFEHRGNEFTRLVKASFES
jgi:UDP-N-acetylmuramoylalanine--D-glutamate ligase